MKMWADWSTETRLCGGWLLSCGRQFRADFQAKPLLISGVVVAAFHGARASSIEESCHLNAHFAGNIVLSSCSCCLVLSPKCEQDRTRDGPRAFDFYSYWYKIITRLRPSLRANGDTVILLRNSNFKLKNLRQPSRLLFEYCQHCTTKKTTPKHKSTTYRIGT